MGNRVGDVKALQQQNGNSYKTNFHRKSTPLDLPL